MILSVVQFHSALSVSALSSCSLPKMFLVGTIAASSTSCVRHCLTNAIQSRLSVAEVDLSVDLGVGV